MYNLMFSLVVVRESDDIIVYFKRLYKMYEMKV